MLLLVLCMGCAQDFDADALNFECASDEDCIGERLCDAERGVCLVPDACTRVDCVDVFNDAFDGATLNPTLPETIFDEGGFELRLRYEVTAGHFLRLQSGEGEGGATVEVETGTSASVTGRVAEHATVIRDYPLPPGEVVEVQLRDDGLTFDLSVQRVDHPDAARIVLRRQSPASAALAYEFRTPQGEVVAGANLLDATLTRFDGFGCIAHQCDVELGCISRAVDSGQSCDDGNLCTEQDSCDGAGRCRGELRDCGDANPCTDARCDAVLGCEQVPNDAPCDDGDPCTTWDRCRGGSCGTPYRGALLHWPMETGEGRTIFDLSGNDHHGDLSGGADWVNSDDAGTHVHLPGDDGGSGIFASLRPWLGERFTFSLQLRSDDPDGYAVHLHGATHIDAVSVSMAGDTAILNAHRGCPPLPQGRWTQVAVSWDGSVLRRYTGGVRDCVLPVAEPAPTLLDRLWIGQEIDEGGNLGDPTEALTGDVRDFVWFNEVLSEAHIAALSGTSPQCEDGDPCTDHRCTAEGTCEQVANAARCDDGIHCTGWDRCVEGDCIGESLDAAEAPGSCSLERRAAVRIDVPGSYVALPTEPFAGLSAATVDLRVRLDRIPGSRSVFLYAGAVPWDLPRLLFSTRRSRPAPYARFWVNDPAGDGFALSRDEMRLRSWHHLSMSCGPAGLRLALDGRLVAESPSETKCFADMGGDFGAWVGSVPFENTGEGDLVGAVAGLRLRGGQHSLEGELPWRWALDAETLGLWPMDEGEGRSLRNLVPAGLPATLEGAADWEQTEVRR